MHISTTQVAPKEMLCLQQLPQQDCLSKQNEVQQVIAVSEQEKARRTLRASILNLIIKNNKMCHLKTSEICI